MHTLLHLGPQKILQCPDQKLAKVVLLPLHNNGCLLCQTESVYLAPVWFEPHPVHEILRLKIIHFYHFTVKLLPKHLI